MHVSEATAPYFKVFVYPLFILFLPIRTATTAAVLLALATGLLVDLFEGSIGVHASAAVFSAFARPIILAGFEPKGGYAGKDPVPTPHHIGWQLFIQITVVYFFAHIFWYWAASDFTIYYFLSLSVRTITAVAVSVGLAAIYMSLFRTKV